MTAKQLPCPCGAASYSACCGRYHNGDVAPDAATLMRSRYSAYVLRLEAYLLATWHPDTRPASLDLAADNCKWLGLEVKKFIRESADCATVEVVARYQTGGRAPRPHQINPLVRDAGRWFYVDGKSTD